MSGSKGTGINIVGGKRRYEAKSRSINDMYVTPSKSIDDLFSWLNSVKGDDGIPLLYWILQNDIWENACGSGSLVDQIKEYDSYCIGTDIIDYVGRFEKNDFLKNPNWYSDRYENQPYTILTNPPYSIPLINVKTKKTFFREIITEWIIQSLTVAERYVIIFARIQLLESIKRYKLFKSQNNLKYVLVYSGRIKCTRYDFLSQNKKIASGTQAYCWFIWDKHYSGLPQIDWIENAKN